MTCAGRLGRGNYVIQMDIVKFALFGILWVLGDSERVCETGVVIRCVNKCAEP